MMHNKTPAAPAPQKEPSSLWSPPAPRFAARLGKAQPGTGPGPSAGELSIGAKLSHTSDSQDKEVI